MFTLFGMSKQIIIDAGLNCKNSSLPEYVNSLNVNYHYTTPDIHRSNSQVEHCMKAIMNLLKVDTKLRIEWPKKL